MIDEAALAESVRLCVEAGVAGYVTRAGTVDDLLAMLESVMRGETLCSPRIAATLMRVTPFFRYRGHRGT